MARRRSEACGHKLQLIRGVRIVLGAGIFPFGRESMHRSSIPSLDSRPLWPHVCRALAFHPVLLTERQGTLIRCCQSRHLHVGSLTAALYLGQY